MQKFSFEAIMVVFIAGFLASVSGAEVFQASTSVIVPVDNDGVQRISITVDSYSYTPNHLQVEVGKPVELILNSVTMITPHNFVVKEPAAGLMIDGDVPAGKTEIIRFTPTPTRPLHLLLRQEASFL